MAASDVWLVGDQFLRDLYPSLQAARAKAVLDKKVKPYLYEYYNIIPRFPATNSVIRSTLARIFNEFVSAMNDRTRLPRYVIMLLDKELVESADHNNFGIQKILTEMVSWLARNIDKVVDLRKEDIRVKRPGAIASSGEPRIIWMKMLFRPIINDPTKSYIFAQCKKYNDVLEETIQKFKHAHIMTIDVPTDDQRLFDKWGNLSGIGMQRFWSNLIYQIKLFDRAETDLRPTGKKIPIPSGKAFGNKSAK